MEFRHYVGVLSIIPEGSIDSGRRCAPFVSYGKVGDYRIDYRTLEYRVPGGALMKHPILAKGLISIGATVIEDAISRISEYTNGFDNTGSPSLIDDLSKLYPNIPDTESLFKIICTPDISIAKKHMNNIIKDISQMIGFNDRAGSINEFINNIENNFDSNIDLNWQTRKGQNNSFLEANYA
jgi:hypothetical protein